MCLDSLQTGFARSYEKVNISSLASVSFCLNGSQSECEKLVPIPASEHIHPYKPVPVQYGRSINARILAIFGLNLTTLRVGPN